MISQSGEGAGILKQIADEGNDCELFIEDSNYETVYDGILEKTDIIDPDKNTIILFDMSGNGALADSLRNEGHLVFGASSYSDNLEKDRQFGLDTMKACGIKLPLTQEFENFEDAMPFLAQNENKKFVFKPSGTMPCKLTYCSSDNEDLLSYMKFAEEHFGDKIENFVLQEFVEGDLISTELFFDGKKVVGPINHTVESKKFMNDDLGPSTGCSGNLVWVCEDSNIANNGVLKIIPFLKNEGFIGQIDLNSVVNEEGVWGLEWTPRMGYDATPTYLKMLGIDYGKFFSDIVQGVAKKSWQHNSDEMFGIRLTIPPYPAEPEESDEEKVQKLLSTEGIPILHWQTYAANLDLVEVMLVDGELQHSNGAGVIAVVMHEKAKRCYEILEKIKIPDKQYRTDLGKVLSKMKENAEKWV